MFSIFKKSGAAKVSIRHRDIHYEVPAGNTLLESALAVGVAFPHDCKVGTCGTCKYKLINGKVKEIRPSAVVLNAEELRDGYRLGCQALPRSDIEIELDHLGEAALFELGTFSAEITSMTLISHDIISLSLKLDRPMEYVAGQYIELEQSGISGKRSYSVSTAPKGNPSKNLNFHVRHVPGGAFTDWLFREDRVGEHLTAEGPMGFFYLRESDAPVICIAGGSGLAPILSLLEQMAFEKIDRSVILLYGGREQRDIYALNEIDTISLNLPGKMTFIPVLSKEPVKSDWDGDRGFVTETLKKIENLGDYHAYLCGPPPMIDAAEDYLIGAGVSTDNIHADRFFDRSNPS